MIDAVAHPSPAMWQGIMLCTMPLVFFSFAFREGKYAKHGLMGYFAFGVVLMFVV